MSMLITNPPIEIDALSCAALERQLVSCDPRQETVIDFADVRFCDSSGIRVLLVHARRHEMAGGTLRLENLAPHVVELFQVTGVDKLLGVGPIDRASS
jgi:anti-anti-sigma factor